MAGDADTTEQVADGNDVDATNEQDLGPTDLPGAEAISNEADHVGRSPAWRSPTRMAMVFGTATAAGLVALGGWLGFDANRLHQAAEKRNQFVEVAKQGAIDLTTISYTEADKDVQRILDSSTGSFLEDFRTRSKPFINVVKQVQSTSTGTVTAAGLERIDGNQAQVLVAVSVKTATGAVPQQDPRHWRMRISVEKDGTDVKVSNVEFVP